MCSIWMLMSFVKWDIKLLEKMYTHIRWKHNHWFKNNSTFNVWNWIYTWDDKMPSHFFVVISMYHEIVRIENTIGSVTYVFTTRELFLNQWHFYLIYFNIMLLAKTFLKFLNEHKKISTQLRTSLEYVEIFYLLYTIG